MLNATDVSIKQVFRLLLLCGIALWEMESALANPYEKALYNSLSAANVFYQAPWQHKQVELVSGDIQYRRTEDGLEGYQAQQTLAFEAQTSLRILDHMTGTTALALYRNMERQLERLKFQTLYRCDYPQCGDISGWQLYLSDKLMGDETTQYYVLAKVETPAGAGYYAQFYVVELDGQPRSFLRLVGPASVSFKPVEQSSDDDSVALFFLYNSTRMLDASRRELTALGARIQRDQVKRILITGHADNQGTPVYNRALAMRRATHIAAQLKTEFELDGLEIEQRSQGDAMPYGNNRFAEGRQRNRRVTVQLLDTD